MLVFGDRERTTTVATAVGELQASLAAVALCPPGLERHAALVGAFIASGELAQGIADRMFESRGCDERSSGLESAMRMVCALARSVDESWRAGFDGPTPEPPRLEDMADAAMAIRVREAEGYAFYALYPEAYLEAARRSGLGPRTAVIGIRSIGLGLAALVAAGLGAPPPVSVRPVGHPFRREVRIGAELAASLLQGGAASYAVVDEGPGLSGSSFGAVADWLEAHGVERKRIHFFPSHGGAPGPHALPRHRERWDAVSRHAVGFEELFLDPENALLARAVAACIGHPLDGWEDISGGEWRRVRFGDESRWPAANTQQERRKFLARAGGAAWLVKFAGLGQHGARKLRAAQRLYEAGWGPQPAGLCHGFLVERWIAESATPETACRPDLPRQLGAYLGYRARGLPAAGGGASLTELRRMALHNAREALGEAAADALATRLADAEALEERVTRVWTDNRMHRHEWLLRGERLIKTDALDHAAGHDLVGGQDVAWDVAGAIVEFDLGEADAARLCEAVAEESGRPVDARLLALLLPCYLAFQIGAAAMAGPIVGCREAQRFDAAAARYGKRLLAMLGQDGMPHRQGSSPPKQ
jgi:hypothetical protein